MYSREAHVAIIGEPKSANIDNMVADGTRDQEVGLRKMTGTITMGLIHLLAVDSLDPSIDFRMVAVKGSGRSLIGRLVVANFEKWVVRFYVFVKYVGVDMNGRRSILVRLYHIEVPKRPW